LDANLHVQIADFGLTRISEATNTKSGALHVNFAAPELFGYCEDDDSEGDDAPIRTQKSDVYAFGCLYYEVRKNKCSTGAPAEHRIAQIHYDAIPFANKNGMQIMALLSRGLHPPRLHEPPLSDETWELIRSCWVRDASKRPRIEVVMENMVAVSQSVISALAPDAGHPPHEASPRAFESLPSEVGKSVFPYTIYLRF
jgi:serine/threonine protein kinase